MIFLFLALFVGALLPLQAAVNAGLRVPLGGPVMAALASSGFSFLTLALYIFAARLPFPTTLRGIAPWQWAGGVMGAVIITLIPFCVAKIGAATTFGLVICGQLLTSLLFDHFGWLGVPQHALNAPRVLGALFLGCGVLLIRRF